MEVSVGLGHGIDGEFGILHWGYGNSKPFW